MADLYGFDANEVEPRDDFDPIPAGKYLGVITESEMKENKAGNGAYLLLTFELIDGPYRGRHLWARLNLHNPNPTAVKIAKAELSAVCRAVGVMAPRDSEELHDLPLILHVKCKKRSDTGEITNEVHGYSSRSDGASGAAPVANGKPKTPTPSVNGTPPWKR
jgi:hypothetical protein